MKKDVLISIKGIEQVDGQSDSIELMTCGRFYRKNNDYYLSYDESETTGFAGHHTTLRIEGMNRVTLRRTGLTTSQLIIEKGCRHHCVYNTGYGAITVGICGDSIKSTLSDAGGELDFSYSMDIDAALASVHRVIISVKECNPLC
ncbi:MAG: DUF1934 domain-containing protein [Oscillospiraceae bacterium]